MKANRLISHIYQRPLWIWALGSLGVAVFLGVGSYWGYQREYAKTKITVQETAHTYALLTENILSDLDRLIAQATADYVADSRSQNIQGIEQLLEHRQETNPHIHGLLIKDAQGVVQVRTKNAPELRDLGHLGSQLGGRRVWISAPQPASTGEWFLTLSRAVRNPEGDLLGIGVVIVSIHSLAENFSASMDGPNRSVALMHQEGQLLLRVPPIDLPTGQVPVLHRQVQLPVTHPQIIRVSRSWDGHPRLVALYPLVGYDLIVMGTANLGMALASWRFATVGAAFLWLIPVLIGYGFAKKLSQALQNERRSQEIYRSIFDHASDAIFLVEVSQGENTFRYLSANAAHGNQCGVLPSKMIHQPPESFLPPHIAAQVTAHYSQCAAQKATLTYELTLEQPAGTSTWHTTLTPMLNADGAVTLLVGISRNMTQQVQLTQKLERITQSLPGFVYQLQLKPDGTFCFPYASSTIETFFGLTPAEVEEDAEPLLSRIHPDDYDRVMQESMDSAATLSPWHCEFRMRNARDQIIWIDAYDIPQILEDGSILWTGYANDITERKHLEASLKASEEKFRVYVESANDIIFALSLDGILSYVSPNWTELLGHDTRDVIGQPFDRFVVSEDWPQCQVFLTQVLKTASKRSGIEYRVQCQNGTWRWHTSNVSPLFDEQGQVSACMGIARDITEQKQTAEHIQHLAHYDWLTDLPNRVLFFDLAQQALHRAEREGRYLALLFLDLDRFKTVNDTLGHEMGDRLLQAVAERIRDCLRLSDTVGRIGGDEFVVLLPVVATGEDAVVIAHRICDQLSCPFLIEGHRLRISASIGIALYPEHGSTIQELSKQADMAMYAAKQAGRNMVQVFQPE